MYIMVLNDGETWTELPGCKIIYINTDINDNTSDERIKNAIIGDDRYGDETVTEYR